MYFFKTDSVKPFLTYILCLLSNIPLYCQSNNISEKNKPANTERKIYALVIGISKYSQLPEEYQLNYAVRDAEIFADYLKSKAGGSVPDENIALLKDDQATAIPVKNALEDIRNKC